MGEPVRTVDWIIEKYTIRLQLFVNEEIMNRALAQWYPSNAREEYEYNEMKERFSNDPTFMVCAKKENEILIEDYGALCPDAGNITFVDRTVIDNSPGKDGRYVYEKLDNPDGDSYGLYIMPAENTSGVAADETKICTLTISGDRATAQVNENVYKIEYR